VQNIKARTIPIASIILIMLVASVVLGYNYSLTFAVKPPAPVTLDPKTIPKYVNQLVVPPVFVPNSTSPDRYYNISMTTGRQQVLPAAVGAWIPPGDGKTAVWGYAGKAVVKGDTLKPAYNPGDTIDPFFFSPSATFETTRGTPAIVTWINNIDTPQPFAVDPTLYWANPTTLFPEPHQMTPPIGGYPTFPPGFTSPTSAQTPVALVPHLHGAEVLSDYDGGPEAWWAFNSTGPNYYYGRNYKTYEPTLPNAAVYYYPNAQEANTLWYHDHALGITRLNVMSGLAGYYLLRDPSPGWDKTLNDTFLYGVSEIPIAIQDRTFKLNGELWFPDVGINPLEHPYWMPEFFGDTIMVNGRVWPNLDVTSGVYRLRLLDGSNARFYTIAFKDQTTGNKIPFTLIGTDGGYLNTPVIGLKELTIAPGERADILIDFSLAAPPLTAAGTRIIMENKAKAPFPNGAQANPQTTGQIMQFTVKDPALSGQVVTQGVPGFALPALTGFNPNGQALLQPGVTPAKTRNIPLIEVMGAAGPLMVVINGQYYAGTATETPKYTDIEEWVIINLTADTHPIHTHLATLQLVSRQKIDAAKYLAAWLTLQANNPNNAGAPPFKDLNYVPQELSPAAFVFGKVVGPAPTEMGWKDTIQMNPGEVTIIRIRFTEQDGTPYPFDPSTTDTGTHVPGYVWHCHIIDHEDNEMMRPLMIQPASP